MADTKTSTFTIVSGKARFGNREDVDPLSTYFKEPIKVTLPRRWTGGEPQTINMCDGIPGIKNGKWRVAPSTGEVAFAHESLSDEQVIAILKDTLLGNDPLQPHIRLFAEDLMTSYGTRKDEHHNDLLLYMLDAKCDDINWDSQNDIYAHGMRVESIPNVDSHDYWIMSDLMISRAGAEDGEGYDEDLLDKDPATGRWVLPKDYEDRKRIAYEKQEAASVMNVLVLPPPNPAAIPALPLPTN